MAEGSSKTPGEHTPDGSPPGPALLGALSSLPEVLLPHLCSFLSGRDLARLGGACAALHESPVTFWPRLRVGLRTGLMKPEVPDEEGRQRRVKALSVLARRAATGLRELHMRESMLSEPFWSVMRAEGRPLRLLSSLHVELGAPLLRGMLALPSVGGMQQAVAEMLAAGQLPMLRELRQGGTGSFERSLGAVWRALGEGACPRLERIETRLSDTEQLEELAEAMEARPEGCEALRALSLELSCWPSKAQPTYEALQALLSRLSPRSLEELTLRGLPPESIQVVIAPALASSSWAALRTLKLSFTGALQPSADGLLHALARGALPSLTSLDMMHRKCSDEAWRVLGEAMGPEGTCLRRLKTLKLHDVISDPRQLAILCGAIGAGHGCPELESLDISAGHDQGVEPCGAALAPAFRPPHGLPRLKELRLEFINLRDLDQLVEALQHRPHASQPVETISLSRCISGGVAAFGEAMRIVASLAGLKDLILGSPREQWPEQGHIQLAEALAGGAGQQLEEIDCQADGVTIAAVNRLLHGLAIRGACPRLRRLRLPVDWRSYMGNWLDVCSLGTILAGRAACSATLREIQYCFDLDNEGVRTLTACLREPQAIQLESFDLRAAEPDACGAVMELLSVLGHRAGDRLQSLKLHLPGCGPKLRLPGCGEREVMGVVNHVVGIIKAGGMPALRLDPSKITIWGSGVGSVDTAVLKRALEERAQAQWLASW